jgi:hypothetical protein
LTAPNSPFIVVFLPLAIFFPTNLGIGSAKVLTVRNQLHGDHESHSLQGRWLASTGQPASIYSVRDADGAVIDVAKTLTRAWVHQPVVGMPPPDSRTANPHWSAQVETQANLGGDPQCRPSMELRAISEAIAFDSRLV